MPRLKPCPTCNRNNTVDSIFCIYCGGKLFFKEDLPDDLEVTAWTENGLIMGVRHKDHPVEGIQFHPESIMTENGKELLGNFLKY